MNFRTFKLFYVSCGIRSFVSLYKLQSKIVVSGVLVNSSAVRSHGRQALSPDSRK